MNQPNHSTVLFFREGSSDKEYHARIEPSGGGYVVNFAFGRRGSTLQTGTKTPTPVDYDTALKQYNKLIAEKVAKGYAPPPPPPETSPPAPEATPPAPDGSRQAAHPGAGVGYQSPPTQRATDLGIAPQLLRPIDESTLLRYLNDPDWLAQEKYDGKRVLIRKEGDDVTGYNRRGLVTALPNAIVNEVRGLDVTRSLLDGEAVGEVYFAFDLLACQGEDLRPRGYRTRLRGLYDVISTKAEGSVRAVPTALGVHAKHSLLLTLRRGNKEGVVLKRFDAPYTPGRSNNSGAPAKFKFTATASCLVVGQNPGLRSVALALFDGDRRVPVGSVTIPINHAIPPAGSVVEVRYLYAFPGGSLFQPVYLGQRDDLTEEECVLSQLKLVGDSVGNSNGAARAGKDEAYEAPSNAVSLIDEEPALLRGQA